jgi:NADPH:quinone reductase-like Zn-dependent oxidoreductase
MQAFVLNRYGGAEATALADVPKPSAGRGEVLIRVHAAGLNPVDYKTREGKLRVVNSYTLPIVMGCELAGLVAAIGADTQGFHVGDRVMARVAKQSLGAFAEFACVDADLVAPMPASLDFEHAAALPLAGLTALQCLRDELNVGKNSHVLINGGAGGVGSYAIPIAKWLGAEVTTTASPRGEALVRSLGADHVIDYTQQKLENFARRFDVALDLVGGDTLPRLFGLVKPGGTVVSIAGTPEPQTARKDLHRGAGLALLFWIVSRKLRAQAKKSGVTYRYLFMHPSGKELAELAALADAGRVRVVLDKVFDFAQIGEAFTYLEAGHAKGKVVVRMQAST